MSVRLLLPSAMKKVGRRGLSMVGLNHPKQKFSPDKIDELNWIRNGNINTVLDIGAHAGETSRQMRLLLPEAFIYAFEPLQEPYKKLVGEMAGDNRFASFQFALGDSNERVEMHRNEFTQSSSLLAMTDRHWQEFPFTAKTATESIEVRRLDDIASSLSLNDDLLVKIDTQGFEDRVIAGGEQTLQKARIVIVEVSFVELYQGQSLFSEIYDRFRQLGFTYSGSRDQLRSPSDGLPLQADAIFMRSSASRGLIP
jgi:FkbM family methyltransferase